MKIGIGLILAAVFLFLAGIHFYWGLGGKWGAAAAIPTQENNQKVIDPKLFSCLVVALGLLGMGLFVFVKSQNLLIGLPNWLMNDGLWGVSALFILRAIGEFKYIGFFKKIKATKFGQMDTKYYSPLCLVIGLLAMSLQLLK